MKSDINKNPILIIEDNPLDLDLTLRAFSSRRLANPIEVARDGEEALSFIPLWENGKSLPVVILLDLKLPKISGLEVLETFKAHPKFKTIPVVVVTSSAESADMHSAYHLGANSYILKPVNFEKFIDIAKEIELYWTVLNKLL